MNEEQLKIFVKFENKIENLIDRYSHDDVEILKQEFNQAFEELKANNIPIEATFEDMVVFQYQKLQEDEINSYDSYDSYSYDF